MNEGEHDTGLRETGLNTEGMTREQKTHERHSRDELDTTRPGEQNYMGSRNQEVIDCKGFFFNPSIQSNMHLKLCWFFSVNYRYLCCFQKQNLKK